MSMFSKLLGMASGTAVPPPEPVKTSVSKSSKLPNKSQTSSSASRAGATANSSPAMQRRSVTIDEEQQQRIMRLKAARLTEKKKQEASSSSSKPKPVTKAKTSSTPRQPSSNKTVNTTTSSRNRIASRSKPQIILQPPQPTHRGEKKKLNFKEIMQQAEKVNSDKMKVTVKVKTKIPGNSTANTASTPTANASSTARRPGVSTPISRNPISKPVPTSNASSFPISRKPLSRASSLGAASSSPASGPISSAARKKKLMGTSPEPISKRNGAQTAHSSRNTNHPSGPKKSTASGLSSNGNGGMSKGSIEKHRSEQAPPKPRAPAPFAKPMKKLVDKRKERERKVISSRYEEYDEDMDDFIVDDEEDGFIEVDDYDEEDGDDGYHSNSRGRSQGSGGRRRSADPGYDRDEIWSMFNRGKRRVDYIEDEDDLSDMEATGADLFQEELRSSRVARQEDDAEERRLKKLAMEKAKRKKIRI